MVTAARWIRRHCTTTLLDALHENPDFKIKIGWHSLGGGTAALLTMLREMKQFSSCTCVTFGPAACMTLELAEFRKPFITSTINGYDIVPTLSASSVLNFIYRGLIKDKNILTAVGSRISFAKAITGHAVTRCTQVVKKHQQRTHSLLPWPQHENIDTSDDLVKASQSSETSYETLSTEEHVIIDSVSDDDEYNSSSEGSDSDDDEDELFNIPAKEKEATTTNTSLKKRVLVLFQHQSTWIDILFILQARLCILCVKKIIQTASVLIRSASTYMKRLQNFMENSDFLEGLYWIISQTSI
ncbi:hypothetical protein AAZX31_09G191600 [Glycine max]